jgi:hypothetical protein
VTSLCGPPLLESITHTCLHTVMWDALSSLPQLRWVVQPGRWHIVSTWKKLMQLPTYTLGEAVTLLESSSPLELLLERSSAAVNLGDGAGDST